LLRFSQVSAATASAVFPALCGEANAGPATKHTPLSA
jgi:hypothetical protein